MTQAPTPGPLSADDVKLLVKGDCIRGPNGKIYRLEEWGDGGFLTFIDEPHDGYLAILCAFIGRPDADGWMAWSGGEPTITDPTVDIEVRLRNGELHVDRSPAFDWTYDPEPHPFDIIAFRLAPTRSQWSVRQNGAWVETDTVDLTALRGQPHGKQSDLRAIIDAATDAVLPPVCETTGLGIQQRAMMQVEIAERIERELTSDREQVLADLVRRILAAWPEDHVIGAPLAVEIANALPRFAPTAPVEASGSEREAWACVDFNPDLRMSGEGYCLRCGHHQDEHARPLASGGQQGEEVRQTAMSILQSAVRTFDAEDRTNLDAVLDDLIDALSTTPARAEAQDEGAADAVEDVADTLRSISSDLMNAGGKWSPHASDLYRAALRLEALPSAHPSPTPAADADRVRIAVDALEPFAAFVKFERALIEKSPTFPLRPDDTVFVRWAGAFGSSAVVATYGHLRRAAEALAALKSTAAKEGGEA